MVVKKVTLSAFLLICPWIATANQGQQQQKQQGAEDTIEKIYKKCINFVADEQIREFKKEILCTGNYTFYETGRASFALKKGAFMSAMTSTKDDRYETARVSPPMGPRASHPGTCSFYAQKEVALPPGFSLPITLERCEDINAETIFRLCQDEVHDYCDDKDNRIVVDGVGQAQQQQQQQQQRSDDKCTVRTIDIHDTCPFYNN